MCVIVPTRSVYLFGIRMSYQKGCAIGTPGWLNVVSAVPKPCLFPIALYSVITLSV